MSYGGIFGAWPSIQRDEAAEVYATLISQATRPSRGRNAQIRAIIDKWRQHCKAALGF